jgi:5'-3' exonuclease
VPRETLLLIDGHALVFRAFFAMPALSNSRGQMTNAAYGFTSMLLKVFAEHSPVYAIAAFDPPGPTFRHEEFAAYKAQRPPTPPELAGQLPLSRAVVDVLGIPVVEIPGFEADDVIGTLTERETEAPVEVITGDRDLFQVVRETPTPATVIYVGKGWAKAEALGPAELADRYDLHTDEPGPAYADMAVLRGDPSDGLPGVPGIGEKTAAKLITAFGSLHGLLQATVDGDKRVPVRARNALVAAAEYLAAAPGVVRVATDAPVVMDRPDRVPDGPADRDRLEDLRRKWNLGTSIDRLIKALNLPKP